MQHSRIRIGKRDGSWFVLCGTHRQIHREDTFAEAVGWADRHRKSRHRVIDIRIAPPAGRHAAAGEAVRLAVVA